MLHIITWQQGNKVKQQGGYHYVPMTKAKIQNTSNTKCWLAGGATGTLSYTVAGNAKWYSHFERQFEGFLKNQTHWGFPGDLGVKHLPATAGDLGSIPCTTTSKPLLLCTPATPTEARQLKATCLEPMLPTRETTAMRSPCTAARSSPCSLQIQKDHM